MTVNPVIVQILINPHRAYTVQIFRRLRDSKLEVLTLSASDDSDRLPSNHRVTLFDENLPVIRVSCSHMQPVIVTAVIDSDPL